MIVLSDQIRRLRKAAGMSQAALAEICHVTRTTIVNVESQNAEASVLLLQRIATALGCELMLVSKDDSERESAWIRVAELERENARYRSVIEKVHGDMHRSTAMLSKELEP